MDDVVLRQSPASIPETGLEVISFHSRLPESTSSDAAAVVWNLLDLHSRVASPRIELAELAAQRGTYLWLRWFVLLLLSFYRMLSRQFLLMRAISKIHPIFSCNLHQKICFSSCVHGSFCTAVHFFKALLLLPSAVDIAGRMPARISDYDLTGRIFPVVHCWAVSKT